MFRNWVSKAFNSSVIEKKREVWIDYLRGIVIILVVYHHAFLGMAKSGIFVPQTVIDANMAAYSFRMPLFFIFSGLFTSLSLASKPPKTIIWKKFNFLFYPYLIWAVIQITLQIIFSGYSNSDSTYQDYLYILYQPKAIAHFWYLPALFNSTLVFVLMKSRFRIRPMPHLILGVMFFLLAPFLNEISMMSNWMRFYIFLIIGDALSGFILKRETKQQLQRPIYFMLMIPLFVAAQFYYFNVIGVRSLENDSATLHVNYLIYIYKELSFLLVSFIGCGTFLLLSFLIERWNRLKWLRIVGFHSLYIYIMHVIVVAFFRTVLIRAFGLDHYLLLLITAICMGVIIPIAFYNLIGKKYLWFLFSLSRNKRENEKSKLRESIIRSSELKMTPLQQAANNI